MSLTESFNPLEQLVIKSETKEFYTFPQEFAADLRDFRTLFTQEYFDKISDVQRPDVRNFEVLKQTIIENLQDLLLALDKCIAILSDESEVSLDSNDPSFKAFKKVNDILNFLSRYFKKDLKFSQIKNEISKLVGSDYFTWESSETD